MIVTVTLNPSFDRTIELSAPLERGQVQRVLRSTQEPGGKGVNVSRALHAAGCDTLAVLPASPTDPLLGALAAAGIRTATVPVTAPIRSNTTVTEPDGTTTKLNEPGAVVGHDIAEALVRLVVESSAGASWLVLAGSLPPGLPDDSYARIVRAVRTAAEQAGAPVPRIAVDSSGAPLAALMRSDEPIDLIKPNAEELIELTTALGSDAATAAHDGLLDPDSIGHDDPLVPELADLLLRRGLRAALVTLGARGAVLVTADAVLSADAPRILARSTVGAGDCSLAGFLLASERGDDDSGCLAQAVAHGAAAASLPGSTVPGPDLADPDLIRITHHRRAPRPVAG